MHWKFNNETQVSNSSKLNAIILLYTTNLIDPLEFLWEFQNVFINLTANVNLQGRITFFWFSNEFFKVFCWIYLPCRKLHICQQICHSIFQIMIYWHTIETPNFCKICYNLTIMFKPNIIVVHLKGGNQKCHMKYLIRLNSLKILLDIDRKGNKIWYTIQVILTF